MCPVLLSSAIWGLVPYLEAAQERREEVVSTLTLQQQKVWLDTVFEYVCSLLHQIATFLCVPQLN